MAMPEGVSAGRQALAVLSSPALSGSNLAAGRLVAEAGADSDALAANGTASAQHGSAAFGLHPRAKTVGLHAFTAIGLKCALGHGNALLFPC